MFEDLDWKGAIKRSVLTVGFYLLLIYVLSVAVPQFAIGSPVAIGTNAVFLFVLFTLFHAFIDRRRRRREADRRAAAKGKRKPAPNGNAAENGESMETSMLKGRQNPNTSRKKAARRRR